MASLPLGSTAVLSPRVLNHLALAVDGEIAVVFLRGIPYAKIKRMADKIPGSEIRIQKVKVSYEILDENEHYDTSASI